jgi:hypothetical protein
MSMQWISNGADGAGYWQDIPDAVPAAVPAKAAVAATAPAVDKPPQTTTVLGPGLSFTSPGAGPTSATSNGTTITSPGTEAPSGIAAGAAAQPTPTPAPTAATEWVPPDASYQLNQTGNGGTGADGAGWQPNQVTGGYSRFTPGTNNEYVDEFDNNGNQIRTVKRANASDLSGLVKGIGTLASLYFGGQGLINGLTNAAAGTPWAVQGASAGSGIAAGANPYSLDEMANFGGSSTPDVAQAFNAAKDSAQASKDLGLTAADVTGGFDGVGQYLPQTDPSVFNAAKDSAQASKDLGLTTADVAGVGSAAVPYGMPGYPGIAGEGLSGLASAAGAGNSLWNTLGTTLGGIKGTDLLKAGITAATLASAAGSGTKAGTGTAAAGDTSGAGSRGYVWDPKTRTYTLTNIGQGANPMGYTQGQTFKMAAGGAAPSGLHAGATQSRFVQGGGTGLSDDIPVKMDDGRPGRLADGEFVISADVVSGLGGGSSKAGAKMLYGMMERIRKQAHGTGKQIKPVNPHKVLPA